MKIRKLIAIAITAVLVLSFSAQAANIDPATQGGAVFENVPRPVILQDFENCTTGDLGLSRQTLGDGTQQIVGMLANVPAVDVKAANIVELPGATSITDWDPASFGNKALAMTMAAGTNEQYATLEMLPSQYDWTRFTKDYNGDGAVDGYLGFFVNSADLGANTKISVTLTRSDYNLLWLNGWYDTTDKVIMTGWGGQAGMQMFGNVDFAYTDTTLTPRTFVMIKLDPATFGGTGTVTFEDIKQISIRFTNSADCENKVAYVDNIFLGVNPSINVNPDGYYGSSGLCLNSVNLIDTQRDITAPEVFFTPEITSPISLPAGSLFTVSTPNISDDLYTGDFAWENTVKVSVVDPAGNNVALIGDNTFSVDAESGEYIITYTVKDGAGNTAVRRVSAYVGEAPELTPIPRPVILQDFENCDLGNIPQAQQYYNSKPYNIASFLVPSLAYKTAEIASVTGATTIDDWDPSFFGSKALKLTMDSITDAQLLYLDLLPTQRNWSKFVDDFDNDGNIDGYFGFFINTSDFGQDAVVDINFTLSDGSTWWAADWANPVDTSKIKMTGWGASTGMLISNYPGFPSTGISSGTSSKSYVMIKLDPENFRGTTNVGVPEDNGVRINFSQVTQITIRINGSTALENKNVYIDNIFVGALPSLNANSEGYHGNSGLALDGNNLIETQKDLAAPSIRFADDPGEFIKVQPGENFTIPVPAVIDNLYINEFAQENTLTVTVTDENGTVIDCEDGSFVTAIGKTYTVTYEARDGAGNTSTRYLSLDAALTLGDVNLDGTLNILDAIYVRNHLLNKVSISNELIIAIDFDNDGKITILDLCTVKEMIFNPDLDAKAAVLSNLVKSQVDNNVMFNSIFSSSILNAGDTTRIENVMKKARNGESITIGAIGGSITEGVCIPSQADSYSYLVYNWFKETFLDIEVKYVNCGLAGTSSTLGVHRAETLLSQNPDFVIVDFAVNDFDVNVEGMKESYESLIRRILSDENSPAVVLMGFTHQNRVNTQELQSLVGNHYNLPYISYHDSFWSMVDKGLVQWSQMYVDVVHPNQEGHKFAADLIINRLINIYNSLDKKGLETIEPLPEALTPCRMVTGELLNNLSIQATGGSGYSVNNNAYVVDPLKNGWNLTGEGSYIEFDVTGKTLYLCFNSNSSYGKASASIDGGAEIEIVGDGETVRCAQVFMFDDVQTRHVKIKLTSGNSYLIYGLLVS